MQERVLQGFLFSALPGAEKCTPALVIEQNGAAFLFLKMPVCYDFSVYTRKHKTVGVGAAQLFYQVKRKAAATRSLPVQESDIRVKPDALQRGCAIPRQKSIGKGQKRIDGVEWRAAAAPMERKCVPLLQNKAVKRVKISLCRLPLQPAQFLVLRTLQCVGALLRAVRKLF